MAFSARQVKPQKSSPAFVSARTGTLSRSPTLGTAPGPPKKSLASALQSSLQGRPGSPGHGSSGSPGTAAGQQWQPRDRVANWHSNRSPDRRRSEAVHVQVGPGSPGIKRIQTRDEYSTAAGSPGIKRIQTRDQLGRGRTNTEGTRQSQFSQHQASRQETLQLGSPSKQISGRPVFQDAQRSPGIESASTSTGGAGGGGLSPARSAYKLKRYSVGGATMIFKEEDIPKEEDPISAIYGDRDLGVRTSPKAWTHSEKMRKWEKRLHGDAKLAEQDEQLREYHEQQQAHDASLTEGFGLSIRPTPGSPRAKSCEAPTNGKGIASHPSQKGMRAAFTDRALKQAHMSEHFSLAHTEDASMGRQDQRDSVACATLASFDMPAAGNGAVTKGPKGALATMYRDSAGAGSPGSSARATKNTDSKRVGYHLSHQQASKDPEHDQAQLKDEEGFFRQQMGFRHRGDMAPATRDITMARARSADSFAGNSRPRGAKLDIFRDAAPAEAGERHTERRQVQNWLPSDRVTMAHCLSSARDDAAAEPVDIVFMQGHSPPSTKFSNTCNKKRQGSSEKESWKGYDREGGRPDYCFDRTRAYSTGRRRGRGESYEHSAESTKHAIARDAESVAMYRYELMACGEATPRARSQPPAYNPLTHEGEPLGGTRRRGKAMTPRSGCQSGSQSTSRLLNHRAGREEDDELRSNRMRNDQAFSDICQFTARQNEKLSQEFAQKFRQQHHHQKSSNMAMLLSWE